MSLIQITISILSQIIDLQKIETEKALNNKYVKYDDYQKIVIEETLGNLKSLSTMVERLKVN